MPEPKIKLVCPICGMETKDPNHQAWACEAVQEECTRREREAAGPRCKRCGGAGYYFDSDGHGGQSWKRPCNCRQEATGGINVPRGLVPEDEP